MQTNSIAGNILTICNSFSKESNTTGLVVKKDNNMKNLGLCLNDKKVKYWLLLIRYTLYFGLISL